MTKTLEERAAEVGFLNSNRLPGEWEYDHVNNHTQYPKTPNPLGFYIYQKGYHNKDEYFYMGGLSKYTARFMAHAPEMAQLIAAQQEEIKDLTRELKGEWAKNEVWGESDYVRKINSQDDKIVELTKKIMALNLGYNLDGVDDYEHGGG